MSRKNPKKKKPPPRWRRHLVQAELELPAPPTPALTGPNGEISRDPAIINNW
jgi:hypothetical protein